MAQGQIGVANNLEKLKLMKQMQAMPPMAPLAVPAGVKPPESLGKKAGNMVVDTALNKGIESMFTAGMGTPATATSAAVPGGVGAAMGAAGPYALAAMAAGKLFGLFSSGGHVGPLYASDGKKVNKKPVDHIHELDSKIAEIDNWTKMMDEIYKKKSIKDYNNRIMNPSYHAEGTKRKSYTESQPEGSLKGSVFDYVPDGYQLSEYIRQLLKERDSVTGKSVVPEGIQNHHAHGTKAPVGQRMMQGSSPDNSFAGPISKLKLQDAEGNVKETTYGR